MTDKLRQAAQQMLEAVADLTILTPREWQAVHGLKINALRTALAEQPAEQEPSLKQALTDPENQPNQFGVEFLMRGPKFAFKVGVQQFTLDYEPEEPGGFEFMRDMLIHAFSTFTPDVKAEQAPSPVLTVDALRVEFERSHRGDLGLTRLSRGEYLSPAIETEWQQFVRKYTAPQPAIPQGYKLVPVALLERLAPEDPMNQDEMGGCVWCAGNGGKKYGDAGRDPEDHAADCPWVEARAMLNAATEEPQPAKQEPLSQYAIDRIVGTLQVNWPDWFDLDEATKFARAIEAAHGITKEGA